MRKLSLVAVALCAVGFSAPVMAQDATLVSVIQQAIDQGSCGGGSPTGAFSTDIPGEFGISCGPASSQTATEIAAAAEATAGVPGIGALAGAGGAAAAGLATVALIAVGGGSTDSTPATPSTPSTSSTN